MLDAVYKKTAVLKTFSYTNEVFVFALNNKRTIKIKKKILTGIIDQKAKLVLFM